MSRRIVEGTQQFFAANLLLRTDAHQFVYKGTYRLIVSDDVETGDIGW